MSEREITILMCRPVEGDGYITPGSIQQQCQDCGVPVWVAPSGQQLLIERGAVVVCIECGLARSKEHPGDIEIMSKQIDEIKEWRRRN